MMNIVLLAQNFGATYYILTFKFYQF